MDYGVQRDSWLLPKTESFHVNKQSHSTGRVEWLDEWSGKQMNKVVASAVAAIVVVIVVVVSDACGGLKRRPSGGILFILSKWLD
jgi:hypothetical protein